MFHFVTAKAWPGSTCLLEGPLFSPSNSDASTEHSNELGGWVPSHRGNVGLNTALGAFASLFVKVGTLA